MISRIDVYNPTFEIIKSFFDFRSVIWTTQYFGAGEFELVVEFSYENMNALSVGNYVVKGGTSDIAVIEAVRYERQTNGNRILIARGRLAISLLDRRMIYHIANYHPDIVEYAGSGITVEGNARKIVSDTAINPVYGGDARKIAGLQLGASAGIQKYSGRRISSYQNLYSATTSYLAAFNLAHRITYNGALNYEVYAGQDRSNTLVFSRQRGNLLSFSYEADNTEWKNLIVIGGDGEGTQRFVTSVGTNGYTTGTERREAFYDAQSAKEDGTTDAAYAALLRNEAKQECRDMNKIVSVAAEIDLVNSGLQFGVDYNVGDIILVSDIIDYKPRITTVIESQNADGYTVDVEFNEEKPEEVDE